MPLRIVTTKNRSKPGKDRVLELTRQAGVLRPLDLDAQGKTCRVANVMRPYLESITAIVAGGSLDMAWPASGPWPSLGNPPALTRGPAGIYHFAKQK